MKKALIVWGGWEGHEPKPCADVVEAMLKDAGMSVQVREGSQSFADPNLTDFDLIVPILTKDTIEQDASKNLVAAIESGVGLAGFHGGMGDSFRDDTLYQSMVGGQWVAHPGNIMDYEINITRSDDPVMEGISDFPYHSEQYYMHVDPGNEVLATTTFSGEHASWTKDVVMPVVWKRMFGKGRVFYSSLGHCAAEFDVPEMKTILQRGMAWSVRS